MIAIKARCAPTINDCLDQIKKEAMSIHYIPLETLLVNLRGIKKVFGGVSSACFHSKFVFLNFTYTCLVLKTVKNSYCI